MPSARPNLVFMMTDHQRYDSFGMVQGGVQVAPNLNRLGSQSCFFERTYNTAPLCAPARTALFTGKCPFHTGVVNNDFEGVTAQDHKPFQQYLAEAGYDVAHVGIDHVKVKPPYRERVPFALWVSNAEHRRYLKEHIEGEPYPDPHLFSKEITEIQQGEPVRRRFSSTTTAAWPYPVEHSLDSYWCRRAVEFLERPHERPFALFLFLWAPHPPLRVPEPYASMFDPGDLELPPNVGQTADGEPANRRKGIAGQLGEGVSMDEWRKVWAAHLGLVNLADGGIGTVLEALDSAALSEETVVVFTVDHGDFLGQHRMYQKFEMYEPAIRMPLLVRMPGAEAHAFDTPVSHLDIMPTLMALMDMDAPGDLEGASLADSVSQGTAPPSRPVFCEFCGSRSRDINRRAVITHRWKYVYDPEDAPELYDLRTDPLEMTNLAADPRYAETIHQLHAEAKAWAERCGDWVEF